MDQNLKEKQITLTPLEQELFQFLRDVSTAADTGTTMRVAGGWVRDKLMGLPADDIDVSLDNMSGAEFGELIKAEISKRGTAEGTKKKKVSPKVAVIGLRPELGKFVETATVHCMGLSLDLLSLRSQVQVGDKLRSSGNLEEMRLCQAAEDAHLRDFTMNALFYNINSGQVEDFVTGIDDLEKGILRCPNAFDRKYFATHQHSNPALELEGTTLRIQEDPLRSLRAIRFAVKYGFTLSPCIRQVAQSESVREFLLKKTTNERILTETKKIFSLQPVQKAVQGVREMIDLTLLPSIFPMACSIPADYWQEHAGLCLSCVEHVMENKRDSVVPQHLILLAAFFTPLHQENGYTFANQASHEFPFTREHMKETWKYPNKEAAEIFELMEAAVQLNQARQKTWEDTIQLDVGQCLRKTKGKWIHAWEIALEWTLLRTPTEQQGQVRDEFQRLKERITECGLDGRFGTTVWDMKPHFTGGDLAKELHVKPGPKMGTLIEQLINWQILHMNDNRDDAKVFLTQLLQQENETLS